MATNRRVGLLCLGALLLISPALYAAAPPVIPPDDSDNNKTLQAPVEGSAQSHGFFAAGGFSGMVMEKSGALDAMRAKVGDEKALGINQTAVSTWNGISTRGTLALLGAAGPVGWIIGIVSSVFIHKEMEQSKAEHLAAWRKEENAARSYALQIPSLFTYKEMEQPNVERLTAGCNEKGAARPYALQIFKKDFVAHQQDQQAEVGLDVIDCAPQKLELGVTSSVF